MVCSSKSSSPHCRELFSLVVGHISSLHPRTASFPLVASLTCQCSRWACLNSTQKQQKTHNNRLLHGSVTPESLPSQRRHQVYTMRRRRPIALLQAASLHVQRQFRPQTRPQTPLPERHMTAARSSLFCATAILRADTPVSHSLGRHRSVSLSLSLSVGLTVGTGHPSNPFLNRTTLKFLHTPAKGRHLNTPAASQPTNLLTS